ncbi:MAG: hypothetical protein ACJAXS_000766 [Colwellia sp.]|jgi:hypothetical protein
MQQNFYRFELNLRTFNYTNDVKKTINLIPYPSYRNSFDTKCNFLHHRR